MKPLSLFLEEIATHTRSYFPLAITSLMIYTACKKAVQADDKSNSPNLADSTNLTDTIIDSTFDLGKPRPPLIIIAGFKK